ncbi:MAG: hypothetical protein R3F36_07225 [Candidatus Competibacteraceae bacterium]
MPHSLSTQDVTSPGGLLVLAVLVPFIRCWPAWSSVARGLAGGVRDPRGRSPPSPSPSPTHWCNLAMPWSTSWAAGRRHALGIALRRQRP